MLKGHARPALLDTYETERRPIAEQVIWAASSLHDIFMTHGKDIAQRKQTMFDPDTRRRWSTTVPESPTTTEIRREPRRCLMMRPVPGDRIPDVDFEGRRERCTIV